MPIPHDLTTEYFVESSDLQFNLTFAGENVERHNDVSAEQRVNDVIQLMNMIYQAFGRVTSQNQETSNSNSTEQSENSNEQQTENSDSSEQRSGLFNLGRLDTDALDFLLMRQRMRAQRHENLQQTQVENEI